LGLEKTLSSRAVKQNLVAIGFPDRRKLGCPGTVQAEILAARLSIPHESPFCHAECPDLKLILVANGCVDVFPKIVKAVNLLKAGQHFC
jgi:hypothetical protein